MSDANSDSDVKSRTGKRPRVPTSSSSSDSDKAATKSPPPKALAGGSTAPKLPGPKTRKGGLESTKQLKVVITPLEACKSLAAPGSMGRWRNKKIIESKYFSF